MKNKLNQDVRVIIREGIIEAVLLNINGGKPGLEIVDINQNYSDYEKLSEYAASLYSNPDLKEIDFHMVHFGED